MISQSMYFPWHGFISQINLCDLYIQYDGVKYSKGSFTNRVQIIFPEKSDTTWMTIPIRDASSKKDICKTLPDNTQDWKLDHMRLIDAAYHNAPYFEDLQSVFSSFVDSSKNCSDIGSIALHSTRTACEYLGVGRSLEWINGNDLFREFSGAERVLAILKQFGTTQYLSGLGGRNYLDVSMFRKLNIDLEFMSYKVRNYPQLSSIFNPRVSILDMIANLGTNAPRYFDSRAERLRE